MNPGERKRANVRRTWAVDDHEWAERTSHGVSDDSDAWALAAVAETAADGEPGRAEATAYGVGDPYQRPPAMANVSAVSSPTTHHATARSTTELHRHSWAVAALADVVQAAGDPRRGAELAIVADQLAHTDPHQWSTGDALPEAQAQALAHAQVLAQAVAHAIALAQALSSADPVREPMNYRPSAATQGVSRHVSIGDDKNGRQTINSGSEARSWLREGPAVGAAPMLTPRRWPTEQRAPMAPPRDRFPLLAAARLALLFVAGAIPVLSIPIQVFDIAPMSVTARFAVLPLMVTAIAIMVGPSEQGLWAVQGVIAGLLAVTAYDALRLPLVAAGLSPDFIPRIGGWVMNSDEPNVVVGYVWRYLGDGSGIGMAFFVACGVVFAVWPAGILRWPVALAVGYGIFIWSGLVGTIAFSASGASLLFPLTPLNLMLSLLGHLVYGGVLGLWLRHQLSGPLVGAWPTAIRARLMPADDRSTALHHRDLFASPAWVSVRPGRSAIAGSISNDSK